MANLDSCDFESEDSNSLSSLRRNDGSASVPNNLFKNDGSFLKMFKLLQQESSPETATPAKGSLPIEASSPPSMTVSPPTSQLSSQTSSSADPSGKNTKKKSLMSFVGKRRGGKALPTGVVKKQRKDDHVKKGNPKDAWSQYMEEVRKYKEVCCEEEGKTRPLVK